MQNSKQKVLVLGASGMLGNAVLRYFATKPGYDVYGAVRSIGSIAELKMRAPGASIVTVDDVQNTDSLARLIASTMPNCVINCIGIVKQLHEANEPLSAVPINSLLPHRLAHLCQLARARLIHFSTDCVFSGNRGNYVETDAADAYDLYGRSKLLGEVDYENSVTLRTSIIGHELRGSRSLIDWFLSQSGSVNGYKNAIFSGLPTVELARIVDEHVFSIPTLHGVYHVSAEPISKFDLLRVVAEIYGKKIEILEDNTLKIDRSLNSSKFRAATGFEPLSWVELVTRMHALR